jgi:acyl-coenzyme A thioesterase PaaI-like protein
MEPAELGRDTAVTSLRVAPGWYTADLAPHWNYLSPSGGVLMTVALRAMQAEVLGFRPTSATALFCAPVPDGPLEIRVEVLRRGNVAAQVRAALSSTTVPGPGLEVSATFTKPLTGPLGTFAKFPQDLRPLRESHEPVLEPLIGKLPFFGNFELRDALPTWQAGLHMPRAGRWFRYKRPPRLPDGRLDPLALPPIADTMPRALREALGPDHPPFVAPSLDLTVHFLSDTSCEWLCVHATTRLTRDGYATADVEIWDEDETLVAFGTQMMLVKAPFSRTLP